MSLLHYLASLYLKLFIYWLIKLLWVRLNYLADDILPMHLGMLLSILTCIRAPNNLIMNQFYYQRGCNNKEQFTDMVCVYVVCYLMKFRLK